VDPDRLAQVLADAGVFGDRSVVVRELQQLSGGASRQTWSLLACPADSDAGSDPGRRLVLRQEPSDMATTPSGAGGAAEGAAVTAADPRAGSVGTVLPGMSTEVACLQAAARRGVPVPRLVACSDDPSVLGGEFMVMDHVDGETIPRRILRDERFAVARAHLVDQCAQALAGIHRVERRWVPGVPDGDPLDRLRAALDGIGEPHPVFELALRWLERNRPPPGVDRLVHGDFRTGNLIVDESGLAAVIDWERAHWGDPVEDLAWLCVRAWRFGGPGEVGGFGDRDRLLAAYRAAGGEPVDVNRLDWWLVFGTLDWGVICGMMAWRHLALGLRSVELAAIGRRAAAQEWDLLDLLEPKLRSGRPDAGTGEYVPTESGAVQPGETAEEGARGPHDRPTAVELVAAVRAFLEDEILPGTAGGGSRDRFLTRVAISALGIAERELALGPAHQARHAARLASLGVSDDPELAAGIRAGDWDSRLGALLDPLREAVTDKLAVANPVLLGG
jgi:aminoglycoside phosphotransferase (APT) family kinase protein